MCDNQTQHWMDHANDLFTVFCGVPSVLMNALVLYIALRYVDFHVKLNQIYVVNMTVCDMLYGLVYMSTKLFVGIFPSWLCACYYIILWCSQIGSVFFLLFLNIDKFISLSVPLHYHMYVTERRVMWLWTLFWTVPLGYSLFTYFGPYIKIPCPKIPCQIRLDPIYYSSAVIVFYIVPLTISAMISVYIYVLAHKKTRWVSHANSDDSQAMERKRARKMIMKRVFFVFSSTLWSTITILPYRLAYCIYIFACWRPSPPRSVEIPTNFSTTAIPSSFFLTTATENLAYTLSEYATQSFLVSLSPLSSSTEFGASVISGAPGYENSTSDGGDVAPAMCQSDTISVLIYVLFCLPPLGAVGNPIITIVTQRFYRSRAAKLWTSCMQALHAPQFFSKCCGSKKSDDETTVMSYDHETGMLARTSVRRTASKANGTGVPLLVTCRQGSTGNDTVAETLCSNRAFQVL